MTREELIQELEESITYALGKAHKESCCCNMECDCSIGDCSKAIMSFILSREKLLLEKIGKVLKEVFELMGKDPYGCTEYRMHMYVAIGEALAIIEKELGG